MEQPFCSPQVLVFGLLRHFLLLISQICGAENFPENVPFCERVLEVEHVFTFVGAFSDDVL